MFFKFSVLFLVVAWIYGSTSVPLLEKEVFWYPTDKGTIVPALLKGQPTSSPLVNAIEDDVVFWHFLIGESTGRVITPNCADCLSSFLPDAPTIFLAHGFGSDHEGGFGNRLRSGFADKGQAVNLVFINWSKLASAPWYERAANSVRPVGEYTARMINFLVDRSLLRHENLFFVGHSLGAHMANYISLNLGTGKLNHIFAMDPALPLFGQKDDSERIDPTDGVFVNVIHTSMGTLLDGGLAFEEPRGHVDFYPNSGKDQPGCSQIDFGACSHSRSYHYLAESVSRSTAFSACKCANWEEFDSGTCTCTDQTFMGWDTPKTVRGVYYLRTNAAEPYGQG